MNENVKGERICRLAIPFWLLLLTVLVSSCSCYTTTMYTGTADKNSYFTRVKTVHSHFLIDGLIPIKASIPLNDFEEKVGDGKIETKFTFLDRLITGLTYGLYSRSTTHMYKAFILDEKK